MTSDGSPRGPSMALGSQRTRRVGPINPEDGIHPHRHLPLPLLEDVPIRVGGKDDGRVAEELPHVLEREALGEQRPSGGALTRAEARPSAYSVDKRDGPR